MRVGWMPIAVAAIADGEIAASVQAGNAVVVAADRRRDTAAGAGFGVDRADAQRVMPARADHALDHAMSSRARCMMFSSTGQ